MSLPTDPGQPAADALPASQAPIELDASDLPAFCPNPRMPIWSAHPRVYLPVTAGHGQSCPYCGTRYVLKAGARVHSH